MLRNEPVRDWLASIKSNTLQLMQSKAEIFLNTHRYHLSSEAKKRLRWLYLLYYEDSGNVSRAAHRIGISRQWLSRLKSAYENHDRDPRSLEPDSRAPHHTSVRRNRISLETEQLIIKTRDATPGWGKEKVARMLKRDHGVIVHPSTVNRYLHKHKRIDPKISFKNERAWQLKKEREGTGELKPALRVKYRPPKRIKDYAPGALVEKDMKFILKLGRFTNTEKHRAKDNFFYQHTLIDSFTRIRAMELVPDSDSLTARQAYAQAVKRLPFPIACANTDNGGENEREFRQLLESQSTFHFYSTVGTPTDNPRVERSHLTDDLEFYQRGHTGLAFEAQRAALNKWEYVYNYVRPHQALGYLTPFEFHALWKADPAQAHAIVRKYTAYLIRQKQRLANARRIKRQTQIDALMRFIDAKLKISSARQQPRTNQQPPLNLCKQELIECQLCSWT